MIDAADRLYLETAVGLAVNGCYTATPNPRVGCLIVAGDKVLGRGWHVRPGEGHAEVNALRDAAGADVRGATCYVSLEPCAFEGRTPACTKALIEAGVGRVVAAMTDPHPRVAGAGFTALRDAGIEVEVEEVPEAHELNAGYVSRLTRQRPFVRLKVAVSLDGRTAMASGESQWITGPEARADVQRWRAQSCAIVTGAGTVLADDPKLTVRDQDLATEGRIRQPLRVIVDSHRRVGAGAAVFGQPGDALRAHVDGADTHTHDSDLPVQSDARGRVDLAVLLNHLAEERQCNEVLVEAGPTLVGAFLAAGLWDELLVYQAPKLLGDRALPLAVLGFDEMREAIETTMIESQVIGGDLRLRFRPRAAD